MLKIELMAKKIQHLLFQNVTLKMLAENSLKLHCFLVEFSSEQ